MSTTNDTTTPEDARIALLRFARRILTGYLGGSEGDIGDWEGGDIQDLALECGLLHPVEVTEPCGENCACADFDNIPGTCYRPTAFLSQP